MNKPNYTALLKEFTGDDEMREFTNTPFAVGDRAMATDAHAMVIIDAALAPDVLPIANYDPNNILAIIPTYRESIGFITLEQIREILKKCPKVEKTEYCPCCQGEGEVEYSFEYDGTEYLEDYDCPICDGIGGVPMDPPQKEVDSNKRIKIGLAYFSAKYIFKLGLACKYTSTDRIEITHQIAHNEGAIFSLNKADLLIMPVLTEAGDENIIGEIKIETDAS